MREVREVQLLRTRLNEVSGRLYAANKELLAIKQPKLRRPFMADVEREEEECRRVQEQLDAAMEAAKPESVIARLQAEAKDSSIKFVRSIILRQMNGKLGRSLGAWRAGYERFDRAAAKQRDAMAQRSSAQAHQDFVSKLQAQKAADKASNDFSVQSAAFERAEEEQAHEKDALLGPISDLAHQGKEAAVKQLRVSLIRLAKGARGICVFIWRNRSASESSSGDASAERSV